VLNTAAAIEDFEPENLIVHTTGVNRYHRSGWTKPLSR
jgi:hypothetical protein